MQHYDIVKHAYFTNETSELNENLEINLFSLYLHFCTELCHKNIMLGSQNGPLNHVCTPFHGAFVTRG